MKDGATWGVVPYLTKQEEEEFASFLEDVLTGYVHSLPQKLALAQQIIDHKDINAMVTRRWWKNSVRGIHNYLTILLYP